jgi:hypothetical protein
LLEFPVQAVVKKGVGGASGTLNTASVPAEFAPWLQRAGALCPQISPALLAAQLQQESGFNTTAVSPVGAQGPAQFMPSTWPSWGRDDDGNGQVSPTDIGDAVMAQGRYMCALAGQMAEALAAGRVQGSLQDLTLAAYNAGPGDVRAAGGVPHNGETETYVARINAALAHFGTPGAPGAGTAPGLVPNDGRFAYNVVLAAQRWIGQRYVWGGGDANGPTGGGFDCSGLTLHAVYTASGGAISLPHNAAAQSKLGTPVTNNQLQPGDLLFFADSAGAPAHHVGIYVGNSRMLDAPTSAKPCRSRRWTPRTTAARRSQREGSDEPPTPQPHRAPGRRARGPPRPRPGRRGLLIPQRFRAAADHRAHNRAALPAAAPGQRRRPRPGGHGASPAGLSQPRRRSPSRAEGHVHLVHQPRHRPRGRDPPRPGPTSPHP